MECCLGIDLGTSSVKVMAVGVHGEIRGFSKKKYPIIKSKQNYAEQDMEFLWRCTVDCLKEISQKLEENSDEIKGIGFSGQMHGLVMIDKSGELLYNGIIWADQRAEPEIEEFYKRINREMYCDITGNSLSTGFLLPSLMWVKKKKPEIYERIRKVLLPKDYIRYKITGNIGTDISDASGTGIFDLNRRQWAQKIIDALGISYDILPECHEAYEGAGSVTATCEVETGLRHGVKVVYGGGDSLMCAVGNGIVIPGRLSANIGTASQFSVCENRCIKDPLYRINTFCHVVKDMWMATGANLSGGIALEWLKNCILEEEDYDVVFDKAALSPAGSGGLIFLPYLSGERTPWNDSKARGILWGLTLNHNKSHVIRSVMEGIVFAMRDSLEIFKSLGVQGEYIVASGGGACGELFRKILANILGYEVRMSVIKEQACMGAAMTAAVGCGIFRDYKEAVDEIVKYDPNDVVVPNREEMKVYDHLYGIYRELYPSNKQLFAK